MTRLLALLFVCACAHAQRRRPDPPPKPRSTVPACPAGVTVTPIEVALRDRPAVAGGQIHMSPASNARAVALGLHRVTAETLVCIDAAGAPTCAAITRTSGDPELDAKVLTEVMPWRFSAAPSGTADMCFPIIFTWTLSTM